MYIVLTYFNYRISIIEGGIFKQINVVTYSYVYLETLHKPININL